MQTLEALKSRIEGTQDLRSVVGTMKSLSAVHIRQYERAVESLRRYHRTIELGLHVVLRSRGLGAPAGPPGAGRRTGILVFGSDYGLCGQFNDELTSYAVDRLDSLGVDAADRVVMASGARAAAALRSLRHAPERELPVPSSAAGIESGVRRLLLAIDEWIEQGDVGRVLLAYQEHRSSSELRLRTEQLLPVEITRFRRLTERPWPTRRIPTFTMDAERLFASLLRHFFSVSLARAFAESAASEHASRLRSMQAAERNIDERLEELNAEFHRRRQDAITTELLDVVSGYEVLSQSGRRD